MSPKMLIKQLENRAALQLLLFLHRRGRTKLTDIDIDASQSSFYRGLTILGRMELIDEERTPPAMRYLYLTGDGEAAAKKLEEIENILEAKREREAKRDRQAHQAQS